MRKLLMLVFILFSCNIYGQPQRVVKKTTPSTLKKDIELRSFSSLNIPLFDQDSSKWCWAASIKMLRCDTPQQCNVADDMFRTSVTTTSGSYTCRSNTSTPNCCTNPSICNSTTLAKMFAPFLGLCDKPVNPSSPWTFDYLKKNIEDNRPFIVGISNDSDNYSDHWVVGKGTYTYSRVVPKFHYIPKYNYILVNDPWAITRTGKRMLAVRFLSSTTGITIERHVEFIRNDLDESLRSCFTHSSTTDDLKSAILNNLTDSEKTHYKTNLDPLYYYNDVVYNYIASVPSTTHSVEYFELTNKKTKVSTRFGRVSISRKVCEHRPYVVFQNNSIPVPFEFRLFGEKYLISNKSKNDGFDKKYIIPYKIAVFPPYPYEYIEFKIKDVKYYIPREPSLSLYNKKDVFTEDELISLLKKEYDIQKAPKDDTYDK